MPRWVSRGSTHPTVLRRAPRAGPRGADNTALGIFQDHRDLFALGELFLEMNRSAVPLPDRAERADDVGFRHGDAAIFAAADRRHMLAVEADQHHTRGTLAGADIDRGFTLLCN